MKSAYKIELEVLMDSDVDDDEIYDWLHQWLKNDKRVANFNIHSFAWEEGQTKNNIGKERTKVES